VTEKEIASRRDVSRIVMATHGRTGVTRWVFGSVAEKVPPPLGHEVRVLQSASVTARSGHPNGYWPSELPFVYLWTFHVLGGGGRRVVVHFSERCSDVRRHEGRGGDLAAVRRHPLSQRHRRWQDRRPARRRLYRAVRAPRRRRPLMADAIDQTATVRSICPENDTIVSAASAT